MNELNSWQRWIAENMAVMKGSSHTTIRRANHKTDNTKIILAPVDRDNPRRGKPLTNACHLNAFSHWWEPDLVFWVCATDFEPNLVKGAVCGNSHPPVGCWAAVVGSQDSKPSVAKPAFVMGNVITEVLIHIYIAKYVDICCGVIIWAKFGLLRCYYLGQVCFLQNTVCQKHYKNRGLSTFFLQKKCARKFEVLLSGPSWSFLRCNQLGPNNNTYLAQIITPQNAFFFVFFAFKKLLKYLFL